MHNHSRGDFIRGRESTSHTYILWSKLKDGIKSTYKTIQNKDFLYFLKEQEFKIKNKHLNREAKMQ